MLLMHSVQWEMPAFSLKLMNLQGEPVGRGQGLIM